jgi:signal transduction histidine kinase
MNQRSGADEALTDLLVSVIHNHEAQSERVSRVLHDEVGQILGAVGFHLDALRYDLAEKSPELARRIPEIQEVLEVAMQHVRDLSFELHPGVVEKAGLHAALDRLVGRYRRAGGSSLRLMFDSSVKLPLKPATALYKIADVALSNAVRHAAASQIEVFFKASGTGATLEIRDNGCGFDVSEARLRHAGLGLPLLEYYGRSQQLELDLSSEPGKGTIIKATWLAREEGVPAPARGSALSAPPGG